jgi:hypothetical protein
MSTDRDVTRTVRSWLEEGVTALPDRVLDDVLDQLPATPQRRASWLARRFSMMTSNFVRIGLAAAIVAGLAVVGLNVLGDGGVGGPTPSEEAATPTASASFAMRAWTRDDLEPGTYTISDPFPVDIELTLAEPWLPWTPGVGVDAAAIFQGTPDPATGRAIVFVVVDDVYADPCDPSGGLLEPRLGSTVADLAAALAAQPNTESTEPADVTISGFSGVYIDYTNVGGDCGTLARWPSTMGDRVALVGERDQVWILDVDGVRLVIDAASFSGTSEEDLAEMRTLIESLTIQP